MYNSLWKFGRQVACKIAAVLRADHAILCFLVPLAEKKWAWLQELPGLACKSCWFIPGGCYTLTSAKAIPIHEVQKLFCVDAAASDAESLCMWCLSSLVNIFWEILLQNFRTSLQD